MRQAGGGHVTRLAPLSALLAVHLVPGAPTENLDLVSKPQDSQ